MKFRRFAAMRANKCLHEALQSFTIAAAFSAIGLLQPQSAQADWLQDWSILSTSGSERLALNYLLEVQPPQGLAFANRLARNLGVTKERPLQEISFSMRPILRYDANINSGLTSDEIRIGFLDYSVEEESRAKAGLVGGAALAGQHRLPLGHGFAVKTAAALSYEYAPKWDYGIARGNLSSCLLYTSNNWGFVDGCAMFNHRRNENSKEVNRLQSITFGHIFTDPLGMGEGSLSLLRRSKSQRNQYAITLKSAFFQWGGNLYEASVSRGQKPKGAPFQTKAIMLGMTSNVLSEPMQFQIDYSKEEGRRFFGEAVVDRTYGLLISRPIFGRATGLFTASRRKSTVSAFSETRFGLDIVMKTFSLR